ncbi:hypothetical protein WICMUC_005616, partial [Wickerhamomyces mucosus]
YGWSSGFVQALYPHCYHLWQVIKYGIVNMYYLNSFYNKTVPGSIQQIVIGSIIIVSLWFYIKRKYFKKNKDVNSDSVQFNYAPQVTLIQQQNTNYFLSSHHIKDRCEIWHDIKMALGSNNHLNLNTMIDQLYNKLKGSEVRAFLTELQLSQDKIATINQFKNFVLQANNAEDRINHYIESAVQKMHQLFFDTGSKKSFVSKDIADQMNAIILTDPLKPLRQINTVIGETMMPNTKIQLNFLLPEISTLQTYNEVFELIPTPGRIAIGNSFITKHNIDTRKFSNRLSVQEKLFNQHIQPLLVRNGSFLKLPKHNRFDYDLKLDKSIKEIKPRPLIKMPREQEEFLEQEISSLLKKGLIARTKVTEHYSVPFVITGKKNRLVVDFRQLNEISSNWPTSIPTFDELTYGLKGSVMSSLDLSSAYHHIRLSEQSAKHTTFKSKSGFFYYKVLAFGLKNAPEVFSRTIAEILYPHRNFARWYLDDILITSKDYHEHVKHLKKVIETLTKNNLHINQEKSQFFKTKIQWLGHQFQTNLDGQIAISPQDSTIHIIRNFPPPTNKKSLQIFLGHLAFIQKFIPNFSTIVKPLNLLLKKGVSFTWSLECQAIFDKLKKIEENVIKIFPFKPEKDIYLMCDASKYAVGCVMLQYQDKEKSLIPIGFRSMTLNGFQTNWPITEKELYAVKFALEKFQYFLSNAKQVIIQTDHRPLEQIFTSSTLTAKQQRWVNQITSERSIRVEFIKGEENVLADYLSRFPLDEINFHKEEKEKFYDEAQRSETISDNFYTHNIGFAAHTVSLNNDFEKAITQGYCKDSFFAPITKDLSKFPEYSLVKGLLYRAKCLCIPNSQIAPLLQYYHSSLLGGHTGATRLVTWLKQMYFFPSMSQIVETYVSQCQVCSRVKSANHTKGYLQKPEEPGRRWEHIAIDIVSGLTEVTNSENGEMNNAVIVIMDSFSHHTRLFPINTKFDSIDFTNILLTKIFPVHGLPKVIHSDMGKNFVNKLTQQLFKELGINHQTAVTDHHQSNGLVERKIRSLQEYIRLFIGDVDSDWSKLLPTAEFYLNSSPSTSLGNLSTFQVDLGYNPRSIDNIQFPLQTKEPLSEVYQIMEHLDIVGRTARAAINAAHNKSATLFNIHHKDVELNVNDQVYIASKILKSSGTVNNTLLPTSLQAKFEGPYTITAKLSPVNYEVALPPSSKRSNKFHISQLKRMKPLDPGYKGPLPPNGPAQVFKRYRDNSEEMEILEIINHQKRAKGYILQVKFSDGTLQWKTLTALKRTAQELVDDYLQHHQDIQRKSK